MTARPCIRCGGAIATGSHCTDCRPKDNRTNREHVAWRNNAQWKDLSKRLRRTSPFCEWCGATEQLTVDHILPVSDYEELTYAVENCRVLCKACNGRRGNTFTLDEAEAVLKRLEATQRRRPTKSARERANVAHRAVQDTRGVAPNDRRVRPVGKARSALHTPRRCV